MKTLRTLLAVIFITIGSAIASAQSMSVTAVRNNARFLTDRMAYTLGIRDPFLIDEIYRINYDYIWGVNSYLDDVAMGYYYDDYMAVCDARDVALRTLLGNVVWNRVIGYSYFYRPIVFANRCWHFSVYDYDRYGRGHFFCSAPRPFHGGYAGGHFFRGMAPRDMHGNMVPPRGFRPEGPRGDNRFDRPGNGRMDNGSRPGNGRMDNGSRPGNGRIDNGSRPGNGRIDNGSRGNNGRGNVSAPTRSSGFVMTRSDNNMRSSSRVSATRVSDSGSSRGNGSSRGEGVVRGGRR